MDNGDGTYRHTAVDGTVVTIDANTTTVTVADGVYTFLDGNGDTINSIDTNAGAIAYDNTDSGLAADNVKDPKGDVEGESVDLAGVRIVDNSTGTVALTPDNGDVLTTQEQPAVTDNNTARNDTTKPQRIPDKLPTTTS
mgnify:CR=1 FL=1